jgi:hypothetical protein
LETKKIGTILIHASIGWALCAATMGIGMATMPLYVALIVHTIGVPIFFTLIFLSTFLTGWFMQKNPHPSVAV